MNLYWVASSNGSRYAGTFIIGKLMGCRVKTSPQGHSGPGCGERAARNLGRRARRVTPDRATHPLRHLLEAVDLVLHRLRRVREGDIRARTCEFVRILRRQADEVWNRRKETAIQRAQTLPTKLAIPLVLCFLPGIFVYTFGPALAEFLRIAEGVLSGAG